MPHFANADAADRPQQSDEIRIPAVANPPIMLATPMHSILVLVVKMGAYFWIV